MDRRILVPVGIALGVLAIAIAFALGHRANAPPAPVVVAAPPVPQAMPTIPLAPAAVAPPPMPVAPAVPPRLALARRLAALSGNDLVAALGELELQSDPTITYAALERNASRFQDRLAIFTGEVLEIQDMHDAPGSFMRVGVGAYGANAIAVITAVPAPDNVLRGRRVRVYGYVGETYSYTSQAGWNITIPAMAALVVVPSSVPRRLAR